MNKINKDTMKTVVIAVLFVGLILSLVFNYVYNKKAKGSLKSGATGESGIFVPSKIISGKIVAISKDKITVYDGKTNQDVKIDGQTAFFKPSIPGYPLESSWQELKKDDQISISLNDGSKNELLAKEINIKMNNMLKGTIVLASKDSLKLNDGVKIWEIMLLSDTKYYKSSNGVFTEAKNSDLSSNQHY